MKDAMIGCSLCRAVAVFAKIVCRTAPPANMPVRGNWIRPEWVAAKASALIMVGIAFGPSAPANAAELGHYTPALLDVRDYVMPAKPGFYFKEFDYFYTTDSFQNYAGEKVTNIQLPRGGNANIDVNVDLFIVAPTFMWVSDWEILGAHYAAYITPTFGNSSVSAALSTQTGFGRSIDDSGFGAGDLFVEPLWLGWTQPNWDFSVGYGFYAPVGKFESGATDNIGMGFWTHQFQGAVAWYPQADRTTAVVAAVTYEINGEVKDEDVTPGQRLSVNLGADHLIPLGTSGFILDLGVELYGQFQMTDDTGSDAFRPGVHDQIFGLGPQLGLIFAPWNAAATFKWAHEINAEDRFQGENFTLNFGVGF
jgi:hypothetical protein